MTTLTANPAADEPRRHTVPATPLDGMTSAASVFGAAEATFSTADWQQITDHLRSAA